MKITKSALKQIIKEELEEIVGDNYSSVLQQQKNKRLFEAGAVTNLPPSPQTGAVTSLGPETGVKTSLGEPENKPSGQKGGKSKQVVINIKKQLTRLVSEIDKILGQI